MCPSSFSFPLPSSVSFALPFFPLLVPFFILIYILSVSIDSKARKLTAMQSGEGESVDLSYAVVADGNIFFDKLLHILNIYLYNFFIYLN
jgi:hypothetical protein